MPHHVGKEEGVGQVMTTISLVVLDTAGPLLEVPRWCQGGVWLELRRSHLRKANALTRAAILR